MQRRTTHIVALALAAGLVTACASTAPPVAADAGTDTALQPCSDDSQCRPGETCSAGLCRPAGPADSGPDRPAAGRMAVTPLLLDFGNPLVGGEYTQSFTIANTGGATLSVATINLIEDHTVGAFTVVHGPLPLAIEPDASVTVAVVLRPNDVVLPTGSIKIHSNDPDPTSSDATIDLVSREKGSSALGVCVLAVSPPPECTVSTDGNPVIDYGVVDYGTTVDRVVGLTNEGDGNLPIKVTEVSLTDPTHFAVMIFALVDDPANPGQTIEEAATLPFLLSIGDPAATPPVPATELRLHVRFTADGIHGDVPHISLVVKYNLAGSPTTVPVVGRIAGCIPGTDAGVPDGGTDLLTDPSNCGQCGHVCTTANGTPACVAGSCATASCNTGFGDCDANPTNGCETTLASVTYCGACTADPDCQHLPGFFCNGAQCEKKRPPGAGCGLARECVDGFCVDGVCCTSICSGACRSCAVTGSEGTCTNHGAQTDPDNECGSCRVCNGSGGCTSATVGTDPKDNCSQQAASTCGRDGACDGAGGCRLWGPSTVCATQTCSGSTRYPADTCDGSGTCIDSGSVSCAPYACLGNDCRQNCSQHTDCSTGSYCSAGGACVPKQDLGAGCTDGVQCLLGKCVDNVCCNSDCNGTCEACNLTGKAGTCSAITNNTDPDAECGTCRVCNGARACKDATDGTDPKQECAQDVPATCGQDGECNGAGACRKWALGTVCVAQQCVGNVQHDVDTCNGSGTCVDGGTTSCGGYICSGTACLTSCTGDAQCQTGYQCRNSQCRRWTTLMAEDFDPLPTDWTVYHQGSCQWIQTTGGNTTGSPSGGAYAVADSDSCWPMASGLMTPVFDLSAYYDVRLSYWHDYYDLASASEEVKLQYSLNGTGGPWIDVISYTFSHRGIQEVADVSAQVRFQPNVAFRFWYSDGGVFLGAWWWAVDDVVLEAR
ncbi:MAG: choice-of-anchor D domain-containing protein [Deltaproteobacteria bacterium]|nr:choice-of-anchor D domain-containing protein [Deltaproteobacteria bacterium]